MKAADQVAALRALTTAPHPDARLLAICERLAVIDDDLELLWRQKPPGYLKQSGAITVESQALIKELAKRPARTAAGRLAKGETAARCLMGGAGWTDLARSALMDFRNASVASEGGR